MKEAEEAPADDPKSREEVNELSARQEGWVAPKMRDRRFIAQLALARNMTLGKMVRNFKKVYAARKLQEFLMSPARPVLSPQGFGVNAGFKTGSGPSGFAESP